MSEVIIVENISKQYRLGNVNSKSFVDDLKKTWIKLVKKENPYLNLGDVNDRVDKAVSEYVWSLKNINFTVNQGDVLGVIGRNGAGKSTLLKILSKVTAPTTGNIKIKGRIASLLEVGTGFHPELTGRENVYLNGAILGMRKREIDLKFDEIIDFAGVGKYVDTPVKRYSSGMYVRLAFAVAAHLESEILIIDEVLAVGDAEFQKKCLSKMNDVSVTEGKTVLFVSHNISAIKSLCNKGVFLDRGQLALKGDIDNVIIKYNQSIIENVISMSIEERKDRSGDQSVKIISAKINNLSSEYFPQIESKNKLSIDLIIDCKESVLNGKIVLGIYDEFSNRMIFIDSETSDISLINIKGIINITIELPSKISLGIGKYFVNIAIYNNFEIVDYVQEAIVFNIIESDFFGNGRTVPNDTKVLLKNKWIING
jgi:lipopolysaccharide transport system ATP-binding protein